MSEKEESRMILAWRSPAFNDVIFFDRIICVKSGMTTGSLIVRLDNDNCVTVFPDEAESFLEALETWESIMAITTLGVEMPKEKKK